MTSKKQTNTALLPAPGARFESLLGSLPLENKPRGTAFEKAAKVFLENDPAQGFTQVWMWQDWAGCWGADLGIDLVAQRPDGSLAAVQVKCFKADHPVSKPDMDSFLTQAGRDNGKHFAERILITSAEVLGRNALKECAAHHVVLLCRSHLIAREQYWPDNCNDLRAPASAPYTLRDHQVTARDEIVTAFNAGTERAQAIMACGSGKTLTALAVMETLSADLTVVLVPSISLLAQTMREWVDHRSETFDWLCVCSDQTVQDSDDLSVASSGLQRATTDPEVIAAFLTGATSTPGRKVVFSTYQSSSQVAAALTSCGMTADLIIADEAHRLAGTANDDFAVALNDTRFPVTHRLFLTATPRVFTEALKSGAENRGISMESMDDEAVFGPVVHRLSFRDAIDKGLLCDYRVLFVGVTDEQIAESVALGQLVSFPAGSRHKKSDMQSLAGQVALLKAMAEYDLHRVVSFHSRVSRAEEFAAGIRTHEDWLPDAESSSAPALQGVWAESVNGTMASSARDRLISRLRNSSAEQHGVLCNAKCLSEGIDVPSLDAVAFVDPRSSQVDIVQAVGRAMRNSAGKELGYVVVSVYLGPSADIDDTNLDETLNGEGFKTLWNVLRAMRSHDEQLSELLDEYRFQLGRKGAGHSLAEHVVIDLANTFDAAIMEKFVDAIEVRAVEMTTSSFQTNLGHLAEYRDKHGHVNVKQTEVTEAGFPLGTWLNKQRMAYKNGSLSPERTAALEDLGVIWDPFEEAFQTNLGHIAAYKTKHGNANVKWTEVTEAGFPLGTWLNTQRMAYKNGSLSPERTVALEDLGVIWDPFEEAFQTNLGHLATYKDKHGHTNVPARWVTADGSPLGTWLNTQRMAYKKGSLSPERVVALENLGVIWDPFEEAFQTNLGHLAAYKDKHGHTNVKKTEVTEDGFPLGMWLAKQRMAYKKGSLSPERTAALEDLGVIWDPFEEAFQTNLGHLATYKDKHGHTNVPARWVTADGSPLGTWLNTQRMAYKNGSLSPERVVALEALGVIWDPFEEALQTNLGHLATYRDKNGHTNVPASWLTADGSPLGMWLSTQRRAYKKGSLSPDRTAALEDLGVIWYPFEEAFQTNLGHLATYRDKNGHVNVPASWLTADGSPLGMWLSTQRRAYKKGSLSPERAAALEALGIVWAPKAARRRTEKSSPQESRVVQREPAS